MTDPITLPALPEPALCDVEQATELGEYKFFATTQMQAYARAAVEADRQARKPLSDEQFLTEQDKADLLRLEEVLSDDEGWDLPKERMKRLAELGCVRHHSAGRYSITSFGRWAIGAWSARLPLETTAEANERFRREADERNGITSGGTDD